MVILTNGPAIHARIALHNDTVQNVSLSLGLSSTMSFEIHGGSPQLNDLVTSWLINYAQKKSMQIPFSLETQGSFTKKVHAALITIPFGTTMSYQSLAGHLKTPRAARAVGTACGRNPFPLFIPCHRVIKSDGSLGGFAVNIEIKRRLLVFESIE